MNPRDTDGLAARLAIEPRHLQIVRNVLSRLVPDREVWAFGSRAGGGAHPPKPWSDLDLAVIGPAPLSLDEQATLAEAFSESDLPWRVDVVDSATLSTTFRERLAAEHLLLQKPSAR
ncbi:nucleotidyltransferase domain-containing protein [Sphaerotilus montanus]|uniref:Putative nucleotidyltransferase n=1 Tax=Sphaerotilus montanus TaxID=522889 RepID=A0A7Y9QVG9_9BURK|nr:nucleotidyltransferase domain-containing protein [Sphaerotilus montanus]NYG32170.1 putative nucleotidyltransferase [Sphaerotilus montanus]NZD56421.1 nucleotidyltransferase domain-containing protein [Sphaerotilus montanus]